MLVATEDVLLEPAFWRGQFAETGGVARLGKTRASVNYTITSGMLLHCRTMRHAQHGLHHKTLKDLALGRLQYVLQLCRPVSASVC